MNIQQGSDHRKAFSFNDSVKTYVTKKNRWMYILTFISFYFKLLTLKKKKSYSWNFKLIES